MSPLYRDYLIDAELERKGIRVIRFSDHNIQNNLFWCMLLITKALTDRIQGQIQTDHKNSTIRKRLENKIIFMESMSMISDENIFYKKPLSMFLSRIP
jgi:hypothetical protein